MRLVRAGDDEQPGRVAIEPVHDPGPVLVVTAGRVEREQPVHERAALAMSGAWMHDDAGRLVDHEQVLVLEGDAQIHLLRHERAGVRRQLRDDLLAAVEPVALRARFTVDEHVAGCDQPFCESARADLWPRRERAVEAPALRGAKAESCQEAAVVATAGRIRRARRRGSRLRRR